MSYQNTQPTKKQNKITISLEYEKRKIEYSIDSNKTLKEFKSEIFYPIIPDIKFFYNNQNLTQFENEKLSFIFKDKTRIIMQAISNRDFNSKYNNQIFSNKQSDNSPVLFSSGSSSGSSAAAKKHFGNKGGNDFKSCYSCGKHNGEFYCRKCTEILCDACKESKKHLNHLKIPISFDNIVENIYYYHSIFKYDLSSNIKLIKSLKKNDNLNLNKSQKNELLSIYNNNQNNYISNNNKANSNLTKLDFYEKIKNDLINNLNIIFEKHIYNIGSITNNQEDFNNLISLFEKRFEFSKSNLDSIFNNYVSAHEKIRKELEKSKNKNSDYLNDSEDSSKEKETINKQSFENMINAFKSISEVEKSILPVLDSLEKIKLIFQIKKSISNIDRIIEEGLENSINLLNRIKLENVEFNYNGVYLNALANDHKTLNNNSSFNDELIDFNNINNNNNNNKQSLSSNRQLNLEKAKIMLLNKSNKNNREVNSDRPKLSVIAEKILFGEKNKIDSIAKPNKIIERSPGKNTPLDSDLETNHNSNSNSNDIFNQNNLLNKNPNDKNEKIILNNNTNEDLKNKNSVALKAISKAKNKIMDLKFFQRLENSKSSLDDYKIFGENFGNNKESYNSIKYSNPYGKLGHMIKKHFSGITNESESNHINQNKKHQQHQNLINRLASMLSMTSHVVKHAADKSEINLPIEIFREGIIGRNTIYRTPFGESIAFYADDTASGRPHRIVEDYIQSILPLYANTHSDNSFFAVTFNALYHQSQKFLLRLFNAPEGSYTVIQAGSGVTAAVFRFQEILYSKFPEILSNNVLEHKRRQELIALGDCATLPVAILTEYEHHSNILSWERWGFECITIKNSAEGAWREALEDLQAKLAEYSATRPLVVISTSAASNITSQISPLEQISLVINNFKTKHPEYKQMLIWSVDCAAYASHKLLDIAKLKADAVFLSPHKLTGGPGSCGLLIFNNDFYNSEEDPTQPGGGTVDGVYGYTRKEVIYSQDIAARETAGTPGIIQFIRAAAAFQLLQRVGFSEIEAREHYLSKQVHAKITELNLNWKILGLKNRIEILGVQDMDKRLSVFACCLFSESGSELPYQFAHRLMSDFFGIQLRSGCNCAGPFGVQLLKLDEEEINFIADKVREGDLTVKPGWVRFNVHFSFTDEDVEYLIYCLKFVTEQGFTIMNKLYDRNADGSFSIRYNFILENLRRNENKNKTEKENENADNNDNRIFEKSNSYGAQSQGSDLANNNKAKRKINNDNENEKANDDYFENNASAVDDKNTIRKIDRQASLHFIYDHLMLDVFNPFQTKEVHESQRSGLLKKRIELGNTIIHFIRNNKL